MNLVFKIAWRNLWRHKGKSLVIGAILFLGALLMTVGNGMISGMEQGLSENIVNLFTGDAVLISNEQENNDILFDFAGTPLKVLKDFDRTKQVLEKQSALQGFLPATAGMVFVFNTGSDMGYMMLMGVDIDKYRKMFPQSFRVNEGRNLQAGERGVLVSEEARKQAFDMMNFWVTPQGVPADRARMTEDARKSPDLEIRDKLVFMGASESNSSVDIEVPILGTIEYKSLNKIWGNYCIVDIESFREAHNYVTGSDSQVEIAQEEKKLLESDDLDSLFTSGAVVTESHVNAETLSETELKKRTQRQQAKVNTDSGTFNFVFLKFNKGVAPEKAIKELNQEFQQEKLNVRVVSWKDAMGAIGGMAVLIKVALNVFIIFIFFVAIIVIMNTLSMAALERTSEIGMMKAIGARKSFLGGMFVYETGLLAFFFGGLGIAAGIVIIFVLNSLNITTTNELVQMVYGGDKLSPLFTVGDLILGIVELAVVTLIAVVYPLRVVGKITPLDAITRE